jgi:hypothetical protein
MGMRWHRATATGGGDGFSASAFLPLARIWPRQRSSWELSSKGTDGEAAEQQGGAPMFWFLPSKMAEMEVRLQQLNNNIPRRFHPCMIGKFLVKITTKMQLLVTSTTWYFILADGAWRFNISNSLVCWWIKVHVCFITSITVLVSGRCVSSHKDLSIQ